MKKEMTRITATVLLCALVVTCFLQGCAQKGDTSPSSGQENAEQAMTEENKQNGSKPAPRDGAGTAAATGKNTPTRRGETAEAAGPAGSASTASAVSGVTASSTAAEAAEETPILSPEMQALDKKLREEIQNKSGDWSLYMYRLDTDEEIAINADEPMVSASLIKLYVAGCYLERVGKGKMADDYDYQLFTMLSESNNESTNILIDVLGMDRINRFIKKHGYKAGQLNRRMLENNGMENYTSTADCGRVLRQVFYWDYVSAESSGRVMRALLAQIPRNRQKIPAGVPSDIETANKTGELFIKDRNGNNITIQNDAAVIFAPGRPYILVVMSAVPGAGEGQLHREIADLSARVYEAICPAPEEKTETGETAATAGTEAAGTAETAALPLHTEPPVQ